MSSNINLGDKKELLRVLLTTNEEYHNHKETMAHVGIAILLAVVGGLISIEKTLDWIPVLTILKLVTIQKQGLLLIAFTILWLLIHIFVRWQLRNRRGAALFSAAIIRTLLKWDGRDSVEGLKLQPYTKNDSSSDAERRSGWTFLDYLFPFPSARLHHDIGKKGFPEDLVDEWKTKEKEGTGALWSEWLVWIGSVFMYVVGLVRILWMK